MKKLVSFSCSECSVVLIFMFISVSSSIVQTEGFESFLQLPNNGSWRTRSRYRRVLSVGDFGARGDGLSDDTEAFENAWKIACSLPARARIMIPAGYTYLVHPVDLSGPCKSRVTLTISGTIVAPKDPEAWNGLNPRKWLYFHGVNHLTVEGSGTINGMGQEWWARSCKINPKNPCKHAPTALTFHRCKVLKIYNLMIINSQQMHIAFTNCLRVITTNLKVIAPATSPNTDGIHISASRGVEVKNSLVRTGDDCISIVNNSSRIRIRSISCGPGHGISIGSLGKSRSWAQVHNVMIDGALLSNTENGVRIKTWQGGGGYAANIKFQNVLMENVSNPIIIDQYYCDARFPCANQSMAVKVENVSFVHIKGSSATEEAMRFACSDTSPCEGLYLEDIDLVSYGGITKSFCWEAYGSSSGFVHPTSCFTRNDRFIKQKIPPNSAIDSF
ncbi:hypothetical protein SLA2020_186820 [Shorea laevis]